MYTLVLSRHKRIKKGDKNENVNCTTVTKASGKCTLNIETIRKRHRDSLFTYSGDGFF